MKKLLFFSFLAFSFTAFSQVNPDTKPVMGFYFNPNVNVGYNLGNRAERNRNQDSQYYQQYVSPYLPNDYTYGISAVGGYNFLPNFAVGTGLKYSYIDPNFHLIYWLIQPKIVFNPGDEAFFIDLTYGKQINHSAVSNSEFWGLKAGLQVAYSKRLSQEGGLVLENLKTSYGNSWFIGLSYGITIFSNKNYTIEGID